VIANVAAVVDTRCGHVDMDTPVRAPVATLAPERRSPLRRPRKDALERPACGVTPPDAFEAMGDVSFVCQPGPTRQGFAIASATAGAKSSSGGVGLDASKGALRAPAGSYEPCKRADPRACFAWWRGSL
jgi:hypothetical protein